MPSAYEQFWTHGSYAVVGHSARDRFPRLTYGELKTLGKKVFAVDPEASEIDGDLAYRSLAALPSKVDGVVIEVPKDEVCGWIEQAAQEGIPRIWIHMRRDTPEALALAKSKGIEVCSGTCAVQYLHKGPSAHAVHRLIRKVMGKY